MTLASVAQDERARSSNCRPAPGNRSRNPLHDTSSSTLNLPPRTLTFSDQVQSSTSHYVQSSYTSPTSNVTPAAWPLSMSWDEKFLELEQISLDAATLLKFLCLLHPVDIPEILFWRMWSTRESWSCDGEVEYFNISVNAPLVDLLTRETHFHENIRLLESFGFINSKPGALGKRKFSVEPDLQDRITGITPNLEELEWLRLVLVCHSFPGRLEELGSVSDTVNCAHLLIICLTALEIQGGHCYPNSDMLSHTVKASETGYLHTLSLGMAYCSLFCCPRNFLAVIGSIVLSNWLRISCPTIRNLKVEHCIFGCSQDNEGEIFRAEFQTL